MTAETSTEAIDHGPYDTEAQIRDTPLAVEVQALRDSGHMGSGDPEGLAFAVKLRYLTEACANAGVDLGTYDWRILRWLTTWEPSTIQVVIGLIARATSANAAEVERLQAERAELNAAVVAEINTANAAIAETERLRTELAEANRKLDAIGLIQTWTNEDNRTFIFGDDIAAVLGLRGDDGR